MTPAKRITFSGLFLALGLLVPIAFHLFGGTGPVFLPMHLPVLLAGFFLGPASGFLIGILTPIQSSLLTGMPPVPILYLMVAELAAYGFWAGYFYRVKKFNVILSLVLAMILGRIVLAGAVYALQSLLSLQIKPQVYLTAAISQGIPGMILQIILIPILVTALNRVFPEDQSK